MGNDNIIMIVVLAAIAYIAYSVFGIGVPRPDPRTEPEKYKEYITKRSRKEGVGECSRGIKYPGGTWEKLFGCADGYDGEWGGDCVCLSSPSKADPDTGLATMPPQAGRPPAAAQPQICPYNSSLLIGDIRCSMPTPGQQTLQTGISPFTGRPWLPTPKIGIWGLLS